MESPYAQDVQKRLEAMSEADHREDRKQAQEAFKALEAEYEIT